MNTEFETALEKGNAIRLSKKEKSDMKAFLIGYAQTHPIRTEAMLPWYTYFRSHIALTAFTLLVFMTGGGSAFAEKSFPGDVLYGVKTGVNEQVLGLFAVSAESRAEWQLTLADRRLQEVEHVALTQNNAEKTKHDLIAQVDEHIKIASQQSEQENQTTSSETPKENTPNADTKMVFQKMSIEVTSTSTQINMGNPATSTIPALTSGESASSSPKTVSKETEENQKTIESAIEKVRLAQEKVKKTTENKETKKVILQAEIELVKARREFFEKKDSMNKQTISEISGILDGETKQIETLSGEIELSTTSDEQ